MTRLVYAAAGIVTVLAPWYGQPAALRLTAWICVLAATLVISTRRPAMASLGLIAAAVSVSGSWWAWRSLRYDFVDAGADSDKVLFWTTVEVGALAVLGVALTRNAGRADRLTGWLLLVPGAAIGIRLLPHAAAVEQLFLGGLGAAAVLSGLLLGHYLRGLDRLRTAAVETATAEQRRALAADLHDYVAHDLAGIAVAAQSSRIAPESNPEVLIEQIERAATRALQRLDHSIRLLRADTDRATFRFGLTDVPDLVAAHPFPVELIMGVPEPDEISAAIQGAAYRVISEALTNVARHTSPAAPVRVSVTQLDGRLDIVVANDLTAPARAPRTRISGTGRTALRTRVEALGGTMSDGPEQGSWQVHVTLPLH